MGPASPAPVYRDPPQPVPHMQTEVPGEHLHGKEFNSVIFDAPWVV